MNHDFLDPINAEGMPQLADAFFALDFLLAAKNGVRNCAFALAETASPTLREILRRQLFEALALHEEIAQLMIAKGWFYPYQLNEQFRLDMVSADTTVKIANLQLYPEETSRLGLFATPNK
ncbi:MAG: spore coat protein [Mycobacterium leprae]